MKQEVSIVVPIYNEQENISALVKAVKSVFIDLPYDYKIIFVDDGSTDATLSIIKTMIDYDSTISYISFSRNFGHQAALKAGIDWAAGDCVISMDGDLQHPPELIPQMLKKWEAGYDVVYTIRKDDKSLSYMKRKSSSAFYKLLSHLSDVDIERGSADFRLMSKKVVEIVRDLGDHELFLRGIIKWVGFKQYAIEYEPVQRAGGKSKYTYKKMMRLALEGITSFSIKPLYIATYFGIAFSLLSILYLPYALYSYYFGKVISGWTSVIVTISFFGGLQLMILGIIGIYLGKLFMQSKNRPSYLIKESNIQWQQKELSF
jgi:dolichol-phosphate mannosyltransferase